MDLINQLIIIYTVKKVQLGCRNNVNIEVCTPSTKKKHVNVLSISVQTSKKICQPKTTLFTQAHLNKLTKPRPQCNERIRWKFSCKLSITKIQTKIINELYEKNIGQNKKIFKEN